MAIDESENAYWYLVYPFQCVIAAEEVIWTRQMENALVKGGFESVADVRWEFSHLFNTRYLF